MTKMIILYIIGGLACIVLLIFIIGICLPKERIASREGQFPISHKVLYEIVTNNEDWQYRNSLKDLVIIENNNGMEIWDEINKDGSVIRFKTKEKRPFSFYSFDMEAKLFTGHWTGEFEDDGQGGTLFKATEYIKARNPFIKVLSYLFFDVGKLMDEYQNDLHKKVNAINKPE